MGYRIVVISVSLTINQTLVYAVRPQTLVSALHGVTAYAPAFAGPHCTYHRGMARL